jgi:hypothetical protein
MVGMNQAFQINSSLRPKEPLPVRDESYKRFIKSFPCLACGQNWLVDPCHVGPHAHSQKAGDNTCLPLCRKCHNEFDKGQRTFAAERGWDLLQLIQFHNHLYFLKTGKTVGQDQAERRAA